MNSLKHIYLLVQKTIFLIFKLLLFKYFRFLKLFLIDLISAALDEDFFTKIKMRVRIKI